MYESSKDKNITIAKRTILAVDDDKDILSIYKTVFEDSSYNIITADSPQVALDLLQSDDIHLVIVDLVMPHIDGLELIKKVKEISSDTYIIVVTGYGSIETSVAAIKSGAYDYIAKPFMPDELFMTVEKTFAYHDLEEENRKLKNALADSSYSCNFVVGSSSAMIKVNEQIKAVSPTPATVLIRGESGTGKEIVADEIHRLSNRNTKPFIKINCAAIPENLLEDELFGHEKGAYTGANKSRVGKFELSNGGTILLDEIGEMPVMLQVKLLRLLQEQRFHRLGSNEYITVDVRIICATNSDLEKAVSSGKFREDLYYRLNVVEISLPALRERREDIPKLADEILQRLCIRHSVARKKLSSEAIKLLYNADFPGNIRELQNVLENALIFCKGDTIEPPDFNLKFLSNTKHISSINNGGTTTPLPLEDIEANYIMEVLAINNGNIAKTAKDLNISRSTLYSKLKKHRNSNS